MSYEPDWDGDLEYGAEGEAYVHQIIHTQEGHYEVKTDRKCLETGNIYVEMKCRRADGWQPSGLSTTKADVWAYKLADSGCVVLFKTEALRYIVRQLWETGTNRVECKRGSHPTVGVLVNLSTLPPSCAQVPFPKAGE